MIINIDFTILKLNLLSKCTIKRCCNSCLTLAKVVQSMISTILKELPAILFILIKVQTGVVKTKPHLQHGRDQKTTPTILAWSKRF